ncbi:hypothetical protein [Legionella rowbothamii]|uniref:hypothetical protein n=1 Tax=Legionella rowbothamii TaxID=96229 RepID=UPI001A94B82A|nr:hypothetical protein [Legionella rowbothamii]
MLVNEFHKAITYIRETQEVALFSTMADTRWYSAFGGSPLFFIMLPFIGILLTINALLNAYKLTKANNKNLDQWLNLIISVSCAVLASISLYGAVLSAFLGFSFALGPWFFLSSLSLAFTHQTVMMGINFYRAYESWSDRSQRMHYVQAAINNLFVLGLLSAAVGSVLFIMLFPSIAPTLGMACAMSAATLTLFDMMWHTLPHNGKIWIKGALHLGKSDLSQNNVQFQMVQDLTQADESAQEINPNHSRLFTRVTYNNDVKCMNVAQAASYLTRVIQRKIDAYGAGDITPHDAKTKDKITVLNKLLAVVSNKEDASIFKDTLLAQSPLAFQSFWVEKGEVEQLCDAVIEFQKKLKDASKTDPNLDGAQQDQEVVRESSFIV